MSSFNKLAKLICQKEGLKKQVDIAQVKEILKILIDDLAQVESLNLSYGKGPVLSQIFIELVLIKNMKRAIRADRKQKTVSKNKNKRK